jgi:cbb3-type cytochrome oxidase maturation protein
MEILWLLIPLSALLVLAILAVFGWALHRGQFEDLEHEGERILLDDGPRVGVDADQVAGRALPEESVRSSKHSQSTT